MKLTTPIAIEKNLRSIALGTPFIALGSCFAERVGQKLRHSLFPTVINPTGIYYNPHSLSIHLQQDPQTFPIFLHQGQWRSLNLHSQLSGSTPQQAKSLVSQAEESRTESLKTAKVMILTLGTAQIFRVKHTGEIVGNCHRLPQSLFSRERLTVQESVRALSEPLTKWLKEDEERRVILTVSPVRYLRGGLVENSRGKAVLLLTCDALCELHPRIEYFPAFEIIIDELRDYRFYDDGMANPSSKAVSFVWKRFQDTYFDHSSCEAIDRIEDLWKMANHRASSPKSAQELRSRGLAKLEELKNHYPHLHEEVLRAKLAPTPQGDNRLEVANAEA